MTGDQSVCPGQRIDQAANRAAAEPLLVLHGFARLSWVRMSDKPDAWYAIHRHDY